LPVFSYYVIVQSTPNPGIEADTHIKVQNTTLMFNYYNNLKMFFQAANGNTTCVLHVEPDMWGFLEQLTNPQGVASSIPFSVASSGQPDVAAFANNLPGFAQAVLHLRDIYAPNVLVAYHISVWGTGTDIGSQKPNNATVVTLANTAANYYLSLQANFDLVFAEFLDRDSGFYQPTATDGTPCSGGKPGCPYWWDGDDFTRNILFISIFVEITEKRVVYWQIPFGNSIMRACDNQLNHYQDNRVQTLLGDYTRYTLIRYRDAGVLAFLFGGGNSQVTCDCDAAGDGITNPPPIDGNNYNSLTADDDGGYFIYKAQEYNQYPEPLTQGVDPPIPYPSSDIFDQPTGTGTFVPATGAGTGTLTHTGGTTTLVSNLLFSIAICFIILYLA